jgi:lipopolysaccharide transport system permease protein
VPDAGTDEATQAPAPRQSWTRVITPSRGLFSVPFREIWAYRDLLFLLVRRDFVAMYTQTILGPLWFVIQPILTTLVFTVVFGNIARISTDGLPQMIFYLAGITLWTYFSDSLTKVAETFTANANIFGKVYFPRMIVPLSIVISNLLKFVVQFAMFLAFLAWYWAKGAAIHPNAAVLMLPVLVLLMAMLGLGSGMIFSALTSKYRDLRFLLAFAVQLAMYATPVIYPASSLPAKYAPLINANPVTPIVEAFRYGFLGRGDFDLAHLAYSFAFGLVLLAVAAVMFNQVEKNFMDTV